MSVTVETVTEGVMLRPDAVIVRRASLDHDVPKVSETPVLHAQQHFCRSHSASDAKIMGLQKLIKYTLNALKVALDKSVCQMYKCDYVLKKLCVRCSIKHPINISIVSVSLCCIFNIYLWFLVLKW